MVLQNEYQQKQTLEFEQVTVLKTLCGYPKWGHDSHNSKSILHSDLGYRQLCYDFYFCSFRKMRRTRHSILLGLGHLLRRDLISSASGAYEEETMCKISSIFMLHVLGLLFSPHRMMMKMMMMTIMGMVTTAVPLQNSAVSHSVLLVFHRIWSSQELKDPEGITSMSSPTSDI